MYTGRAMRRARILAMRVVYSTLDEVYSVVLRTDRELVRLKRNHKNNQNSNSNENKKKNLYL